MKISSKKCKFDANFIFLRRQNFALATSLNFEFSMTISFSKTLENGILEENPKLKKVAKTKSWRLKK